MRRAADRLGRVPPPVAVTPGIQQFDDYPLEKLAELDRLDAVLPDLGADGHLPRDPGRREKYGEVARSLFADAQAMLGKIISEKWITPRAVVGIWPAKFQRNG